MIRPRPVCVVNFSIGVSGIRSVMNAIISASVEIGRRGQVPGDSSRCGDERRHQVRAAALALAAFEVAVRRRRAPFARVRACRGSSPGTSSTRPHAIRTRPR